MLRDFKEMLKYCDFLDKLFEIFVLVGICVGVTKCSGF